MDSQWLHHLLSIYLSLTITISKSTLFFLSYLKRFPFIVATIDSLLSIFFQFHGLSPCTVDLDDQTTMHYWIASHRRFNKPNLVLIHGYGSTSKWQFYSQVRQLSRTFNLYLPGLLFFGDSYTSRPDRSEVFQARCVSEGLKRLGVERFSVYAISYGGWVGFRLAEMYPETVEKVVIVSSGIAHTEEQKEEHLRKVEMDIRDMLCPEKPEHLRALTNLTMHKSIMGKWVPDFFLNDYIRVMCKKYRKERIELVDYLIAKKADSELPILTQETLLVWGDQDKVFPPYLAHQLQRHLGPKSKVEILKGVGHAVNVEGAEELNDLIESFVLRKCPKLVA